MGQLDIAAGQHGVHAHILDEVSGRYSEERIVMVGDGSGWHKSKQLKLPKNRKLLPLPPDSPELNPVENIWEELRENTFTIRYLQAWMRWKSNFSKACDVLNFNRK